MDMKRAEGRAHQMMHDLSECFHEIKVKKMFVFLAKEILKLNLKFLYNDVSTDVF